MVNERDEALSLLRRWKAGPSPVYVVFSSPWFKGIGVDTEVDTEEEFEIKTALVASVSEEEIRLLFKSEPLVSLVLNIAGARLRSISPEEIQSSPAAPLDICVELEFTRGRCLIASFKGLDFDPES